MRPRALPGSRLPVPAGQVVLLRRRRRRRWWIAAAVVVVVGGGGAAWKLTRPKVEAVEYKPYTVVVGDLKIVVSSAGEVSPQNRIVLRPPLSGRIDQILVREGDAITKGQVLAWISSSDRAGLLDAARAKGPDEVKRWEDVYKPTPLVAPLPGFIIARNAEPGQTVGGGDGPLVMADRLIVRAQVDETDLAKIKLGQAAEISLDAYPDAKIPGRVVHVAYESHSVNNVTVYDMEVQPDATPDYLRSGMTATVGVVVKHPTNILLVPAEALTESPKGGLQVLLQRAPAPPEPRIVELGISDGGKVEVKKGLKAGDVLLVNVHGMPPSSLADTTSPFMPKWKKH